jgi:hypothetical protein
MDFPWNIKSSLNHSMDHQGLNKVGKKYTEVKKEKQFAVEDFEEKRKFTTLDNLNVIFFFLEKPVEI